MTLAHRLPAAGSVAASDERAIIVRLLNVIYLEKWSSARKRLRTCCSRTRCSHNRHAILIMIQEEDLFVTILLLIILDWLAIWFRNVLDNNGVSKGEEGEGPFLKFWQGEIKLWIKLWKSFLRRAKSWTLMHRPIRSLRIIHKKVYWKFSKIDFNINFLILIVFAGSVDADIFFNYVILFITNVQINNYFHNITQF